MHLHFPEFGVEKHVVEKKIRDKLKHDLIHEGKSEVPGVGSIEVAGGSIYESNDDIILRVDPAFKEEVLSGWKALHKN